MGLLLKIILFGVVVYGAWKTLNNWKGLFDRFVGKPEEPARPAPPSEPVSARKVTVEDTIQCAGCGAYIPATAAKCGQCGRPQPQGRSTS